MGKVTMLTIIPKELAMDLNQKKRVKDYNTLPQLNKSVLETIRKFFEDKVGYTDLPMACLMQPRDKNGKVLLQTDFADYLPVNNKESVLFLLEMPEDTVVSIDYSELLEASDAMNDCGDDEGMLEFLQSELTEKLEVGVDFDNNNIISFIPFLDYSRCKFFAAFNSEFELDESLDLPGLSPLNLRELTSFIN